MVLIILLRIAVKTTKNYYNDVPDARSCWPLRAASLRIYEECSLFCLLIILSLKHCDYTTFCSLIVALSWLKESILG